jgi:UDP-GlcNAc3NAcA epimerase
MKILTVLGARPQFIKSKVVSTLLKSSPGISEIILHTGQHFDFNLSQIFFNELNIEKPKYLYNSGGFPYSEMLANQMLSINEAILAELPDLILVYGDTISTLSGALSASFHKINLVHVEAGVRSFDKKMPEENNRVLTDHLANLMFAPSLTAVDNLKGEGICKSKIILSGDVMFDSFNYYIKLALAKSKILSEHALINKKFMLITIHREENILNPKFINRVFEKISYLNLPAIFPAHPRFFELIKTGKVNVPKFITVTKPIGYFDMLALEHASNLIITDSGGIQREAYYAQVPCIILRKSTEWVELTNSGVSILFDENMDMFRSIQKAREYFRNNLEFYKNSHASSVITNNIISKFG